jgi:hypothetical protein
MIDPFPKAFSMLLSAFFSARALSVISLNMVVFSCSLVWSLGCMEILGSGRGPLGGAAPRRGGASPRGASVLEGLGDVVGLDLLVPGEVRDGTRHSEHLAVAAGREPQALGGGQEQAPALRGGSGDPLQLPRGERRVGGTMDLLDLPAALLALAGGDDALADRGGWLAGPHGLDGFEGDRGQAQVEVDAIQQGPREASSVLADALGGAAAALGARVAAGTWVTGGDQQRASREGGAGPGAGDDEVSVFEGLAERFKGGAAELRQLVEEEDAVVREG